jgi:hypothetical protein
LIVKVPLGALSNEWAVPPCPADGVLVPDAELTLLEIDEWGGLTATTASFNSTLGFKLVDKPDLTVVVVAVTGVVTVAVVSPPFSFVIAFLIFGGSRNPKPILDWPPRESPTVIPVVGLEAPGVPSGRASAEWGNSPVVGVLVPPPALDDGPLEKLDAPNLGE